MLGKFQTKNACNLGTANYLCPVEKEQNVRSIKGMQNAKKREKNDAFTADSG